MQTNKRTVLRDFGAAVAYIAGMNTTSEEPEVRPDSRQVRRAKERREFKPAPKLNPWGRWNGVIHV